MPGENKKEPVKKEDLIKDYPDHIKKKKKEYFHELKALWKEKNYPGIAVKAREAIAELPEKPKGTGDADISGVYLLYASALWEMSHNKDEALPIALLAAHFDRSNIDAMWLIREINGAVSDSTKLFRIDVSGEYYTPVGNGVQLFPFTTTYQVVADDPGEAMEYIQQFERKDLAERMRLKEYVVKKEVCPQPKGVYHTTTLFSHNLEEDK